MTEAIAPEQPAKTSKLPLIIGLVLAIAGGAAGFLLLPDLLNAPHVEAESHPAPALSKHGFLELEPILVSLGPMSASRQLKFHAQLEVTEGMETEVSAQIPRIIDVMNTYLRAVQTSDFEDPTILYKLRAQLLRRIQIVLGEGRVRDLLIMEFILN